MKIKIVVFFTLLNTALALYAIYSVNELRCQSIESVFAERKFVYPSLKALGQNPDDNNRDIKNPLTINEHNCIFKFHP